MLSFRDGRHLVEDFLPIDAVVHESVYREVAHTEGGEVLEEMSALTGFDAIVLQTSLHNDFGGGDSRPLDGNAQPRVAGAPTPRSDQHIAAPLLKETAVDGFYFIGNGGIEGGGLVVGLDIDDVLHVGDDAMAYGVV